jgi:hypothetical protein
MTDGKYGKSLMNPEIEQEPSPQTQDYQKQKKSIPM